MQVQRPRNWEWKKVRRPTLVTGAPGLPRHSLRRRRVSDRLKPSDDLAVTNHAQIPHIQSRLQAGAAAPTIHCQFSVVSARDRRAKAAFAASSWRRFASAAAGHFREMSGNQARRPRQ
jgi:hypothetical protein